MSWNVEFHRISAQEYSPRAINVWPVFSSVPLKLKTNTALEVDSDSAVSELKTSAL
jgi:hypothetical protein